LEKRYVTKIFKVLKIVNTQCWVFFVLKPNCGQKGSSVMKWRFRRLR